MKTGTKVMIGAVALAAVGGIGYYLWSKGKQVSTDGFGAYGPSSFDGKLKSPFQSAAKPTYSYATPRGVKMTGLV
jgi:hypothetical protein